MKLVFSITMLLMFGMVVGAEEAQTNAVAGTGAMLAESGGFAGPAATVSQMQEDEASKEAALRFPWFDNTLQPWFDMKSALREKTGLQLGLAYTALYQGVADYDDVGGGIFRLSGNWTLLNRDDGNNGSLVFSVDERHAYTDSTPGVYDGVGAGYHGITGSLFNDVGLILGDFNWQQQLLGGKAAVVVGRYDPNDFSGVLGYANPWTTFQNLTILFNPSISLPDWSYGIGAGSWFDDQYYLKAAVNDANGTADHLEFFSEGAEMYSSAEIGWSPSSTERYMKNVHLMGWHVDDATRADLEESYGLTFAANWTWNEVWMAFTKMGWSEGSAPLYNKSVTVGAMYRMHRRSDLVGIALNWGEPAVPELRDQYTGELFYRFQLAQNLAITPSVQLLIDPALNPDEDYVWIGGLRARLTL